MSIHYALEQELNAALQAGRIETSFHYLAKRAMRAANMSGRQLRTLEEVAEAVKALQANGGVTRRRIYNDRYC